MNKLNIKHYRYFAVMMVVIFMLSIVGMLPRVSTSKKNNISQAKVSLSSQDKEIVNEISNMTGINSEKVIKLKTSNNTWNDVLDKLKNYDNTAKNEEKSKVLAESGIDAGFINSLRKSGFSNNKIIEAKSLVERVNSQLKQILDSYKDESLTTPNKIDSENVDKQEIESYKVLASKIEAKTAVYLLLRLEKDFESMDKIFDEYLLSLQIDTDLNKYIVDKKGYEKEKIEKSAKFDMSKIITMAKIESKLMEVIQKENSKIMNTSNVDNVQKDLNKQTDINNVTKSGNDDVPKSPLPDVQNPTPQNPQADLIKEINDLKNKSLN